MSKCKNCNVEILDDSQICPLCHSVLEEGEEGRNTIRMHGFPPED